MTDAHPRRRFQFGLRTLLLAIVGLSLLFSWLAVKIQCARRQREAVEAIRQLRGEVLYDWLASSSARPSPLCELFEDDLLHNVVAVSLSDVGCDSALVHLKGIADLRLLSLEHSAIGDEGLKCLRDFRSLESLGLADTLITDEGLKHLKGLTNLEVLYLQNTSITDAGLVHLKKLNKLRVLHLHGTSITDAGLEHLKELVNLETLRLGNNVSALGVAQLRLALPDCEVRWSRDSRPPADIGQIAPE